MYCAHIRKDCKTEQSVKEHLENVANLARENGKKINLKATAELVGILHDMGKETKRFDNYIRYSVSHPGDKSLRGTVNHTSAGARFIYKKYHSGEPFDKLTAEIISMAICSHHGGLVDYIGINGNETFKNKINTDKDICYEESVCNFIRECLNYCQIEDLFLKSKEEIKKIVGIINSVQDNSDFRRFSVGMLQKYVFSCLIDADRYDTYAFMEDRVCITKTDNSELWDKLCKVLEGKLKLYPRETKMGILRSAISDECMKFSSNETGIYELSVPTGGGKTFSSLRYALHHAKKFNKDRIFYIIPFTTIIDQNVKEVKQILDCDDIILEHHSNLVIDKDENDGKGSNNDDYKILTERWNNPMIFTTMVQFMETLFGRGTQSIRRLHNLSNSVIIFDEIQCIPIKCINMFNSAMNFLSEVCNTTIVLCTATQPLLSKSEMPIKLSTNYSITKNAYEKFESCKRVNLIDKTKVGGYDIHELKGFILEKMNSVKSMLIIVNTKSMATSIFNELKVSNSELDDKDKFHIFHLSTNMCATHRMAILGDINKKLGHERVICVSTQLIEAGVNISFQSVIRSLAGLDSIAQASGRCNRHGELPCGETYIFNLKDENVSKLKDIKEGQECTKRVLYEFEKNPDIFGGDLLSPKAIELYYQYYFYERKDEMNYNISFDNTGVTIYDLLSKNSKGNTAFREINHSKPEYIMTQAFKTASDNFTVINGRTMGIIVPYEEGEKIITLINGNCDLENLRMYLKQAQRFSVNLYETDVKRLQDLGALTGLKDNAIISLKKEFYDKELGVVFKSGAMEFYNQ